MSPFLADYLAAFQKRVNTRLMEHLDALSGEAPRLREAMHYALRTGGKRLRPVLAYAACQACGGRTDDVDDVACALEFLHTYSLVHDDLPAMDDDALRRGQPTCHIAFDEATAILAGDALQTLAFEVLAAACPALDPLQRLALVTTLAQASGAGGMAGGQALDLAAEGKALDLTSLEQIHRLKTGRLIRAAVRMGGLVAGADEGRLDALDEYADAIGLAFQVHDDILDVIGDTTTLGKQQGADATLGKATYPGLLGLEAARALAQSLRERALNALVGFDERAHTLRALADYIVDRDH
jgi:geranylgeranyl diphosphate synthase type II